MDEVWRPIATAEGYEVSNFGAVKSLPGGRRHGKILKQSSLPKTGYKQVFPCVNGKSVPMYVHRLVLEAFVGTCPDGMECRHLDGDPSNNMLENLCWGTPKQNQHDRKQHGTFGHREQHSQAKLNEAAVQEIRSTTGRGSGNALAKKFGVAPSVISRVRSGELWS